MYKSESHFLDAVIKFIIKNENNPLDIDNTKNLPTEFIHSSGRVDLLAVNKQNKIIAIEAKLFNWKKALWQAYRSSCYAHYTYVLIPKEQSKNAVKFKDNFENLGVGLCSYHRSEMNVEIEAKHNEPFSSKLTERAYNTIYGNSDTPEVNTSCSSYM